MKNIITAGLIGITLAGCGDSQSTSTNTAAQNDSKPKAQVQASAENAISLPDGTRFTLNGKILRNEIVTVNDKKSQRYEINFPNEVMNLEGSIFSILVKSGYTRKIITEEPDNIKVHYYKKGFTTVGTQYRKVELNHANGSTGTRLSLYWQL